MTFVSERTVKAVRKRHRCDGCGRHIEAGQSATRWAGLTDGDFNTAIYHPDCREAELAMNALIGTQYGDEWWPLSEIETDDRPWLIETFPAVAARMGFALPNDGALAPHTPPNRPNSAINSTTPRIEQ